MSTMAMVSSFALVGCASGSLASHDTRTAEVADARAKVALRTCAGNLRLLAPGRLGDTSESWLVDTGASGHWSPWTTRPPVSQGVLRPAFSPVAVDDVFVFHDARTTHDPVCSASGSEPILSPQLLAPKDGAVELDLRHGTLFRLPSNVAISARDEVARSGTSLTACRAQSNGFLPVVAARVDGRDVSLVVDTGSPFTALFANTAAGASTTMRATAHYFVESSWSDGRASDLAIVPNANVKVGGQTTTLPIVVVSPAPLDGLSCRPDGVLGLDLLRACTIVLDATGGALACEAPSSSVEPAWANLKPTPRPTGLNSRARPLPAGTVATLGCVNVTDVEVAAWAKDRAVQVATARDQVVRARLFEHVAASMNVDVSTEEIERVIQSVGLENNLDEVTLGAELAKQHLTLAHYRHDIATQLRERNVVMRTGSPNAATTNALSARLRDRLGRVPISREHGSCHEEWPRYYLDQIVLLGLEPADESAVRLALAGLLQGREVSLGPLGTLPSAWTSAVSKVFEARTLTARSTVLEEASTLRVRIELIPAP